MEMSNEERKRVFDDMLKEISLRIFLKATPYASGERSILDKILNPDIYYEHLYAHSKKAQELFEEIIARIKKNNTRNIIFSGYQGCGKTTFTYNFLRNCGFRSLVLNFDDFVEEGKEIKHKLVMFLYEKIYLDIRSENHTKRCKISERFCELYLNNENQQKLGMYFDDKNVFRYLADKIEWAVNLAKRNSNELYDYLEKDIKIHISNQDINWIMISLVLWDVADRIENNLNRECCIVFENLDVIYNTSRLPEFVRQIVNFRNNIDRVFQKLSFNGQPLGDPTQDYILIFVMRETTKSEFTECVEHFNEQRVKLKDFDTLSFVYDMGDIIQRRNEYLKKLLHDDKKLQEDQEFVLLVDSVDRVKILMDDFYVRENICALFNHDYRTGVEVLSEINFKDEKLFRSCIELRNKDSDSEETWNKFGSRSILLREIFNLFIRSGYLNKMKNQEYCNDKAQLSKINLDRMILLFLNNSQTIMETKDKKEKEYVSIDILFNEVSKFCKDKDAIVNALWEMYGLRKLEYWNHLVSFDDMQEISLKSLQRQMEMVINNEKGRYSKVKITTAGSAYLDIVLPHFEYYAARKEGGRGNSLFSFTAEELCNIPNIETFVKEVRAEVVDCCTRLTRFFEDVFDMIDEFKGEKFLDTKFASIKINDYTKNVTRMYHCERIIYAHIGYLDNLRFYLFYLLDEVLNNKGFKNDVDITKIIRMTSEYDKSFSSLFPNKLLRKSNIIILLKAKKDKETSDKEISNKGVFQTLQIREGLTCQETVIELEYIVNACKKSFNQMICNQIIKYCNLFEKTNGKKYSMQSKIGEKLVECFKICIEYIEKMQYQDFDTSIDRTTGERLLRRRNRDLEI